MAYCAVSTAVAVGAGLTPAVQRADIWLTGIDGRGRTRLTDGLEASFSPVWSREGQIYFTRRCQGRENVWSLLPPSPRVPAARPALGGDPRDGLLVVLGGPEGAEK